MKSEIEIWKSLPGVPGVEVSTFGNVRTLDKVTSSERVTRFIKGKILKQSANVHGYLHVSIKVDGKFITKTVHRLVAETFIPNPDNLPQVNHKDCDRKNNNVENLEWVTHEENIAYREKYGEAQNKPVLAINLSTLKVSRFESQMEASRVLGVSHGNINNVIKGRLNKTHGYWFTNDDENAADDIKHKLEEV